MRLYHLVAQAPAPRSYVGKLLVICFLGTHAPLIAFGIYAIVDLPFDRQVGQLSLLILFATLGGTLLTLLLIRALLSPIVVAEKALKAYIRDGIRPVLPTHYRDEAGALLAEIQHVVDHLENCLSAAQRRAMTDPLTLIGNRRWLTIEGRKVLALAKRSHAPLNVIMFDIDHFKSVNDRFGHAAGDEVLRSTASAIRTLLRPYDLFARFGGEEFCIVLPGTGLDEAIEIAERLRACAANLAHEAIGYHTVTASFGVASMGPSRQTLPKMISAADASLYAAKHAGRNRVRAAPNETLDAAA